MKMKILAVATFVILSLPFAAQAQGTIRGAEEGAAAGERAAGLSAASWASRSGRGFANMSYMSITRRSGIPARCTSARCFPREA